MAGRRREVGGRGEDQFVAGEGAAQGAQGGHPGEQVAEAEGPQDQDASGHRTPSALQEPVPETVRSAGPGAPSGAPVRVRPSAARSMRAVEDRPSR